MSPFNILRTAASFSIRIFSLLSVTQDETVESMLRRSSFAPASSLAGNEVGLVPKDARLVAVAFASASRRLMTFIISFFMFYVSAFRNANAISPIRGIVISHFGIFCIPTAIADPAGWECGESRASPGAARKDSKQKI